MNIESKDNLTKLEMLTIMEHYREKIAELDAKAEKDAREDVVLDYDIEASINYGDFGGDGDMQLNGYIGFDTCRAKFKYLHESVANDVAEHFLDYVNDYKYPGEFRLSDFQEGFHDDLEAYM